MTAPTAPASYTEALAMAEVILQAPPDTQAQEIVRLMSQQVIRSRIAGADWAKQQLLEAWKQVNAYDPASVSGFAAYAAQVMKVAQDAVARTTMAAQVQQLSSVGVRIPTPVPESPVNVRASRTQVSQSDVSLVRSAVTVNYQPATPEAGEVKVRVGVADSTTREVFTRPAAQVRYVRSQGGTMTAAQAAATDRIKSLVDDNLMLAQRLAEAESLAKAQDLDRRVIGYRRVIHPELAEKTGTCGMCIAASDRIYRIGELKPIHAGCHCTVAAVTKSFDPGHAVNTLDLRQLYGDAQGNTNATLKLTRYRVDEHGELGAVLVPAAPHKPRRRAR